MPQNVGIYHPLRQPYFPEEYNAWLCRGGNFETHKKAVMLNVGTVLVCETTSCRVANCSGMSITARILTKSQNIKSKKRIRARKNNDEGVGGRGGLGSCERHNEQE